MRVVSFLHRAGSGFGVAADDGTVIDVSALSFDALEGQTPASVLSLVDLDSGVMEELHRRLRGGETLDEVRLPLASVQLLPPIPRPPKNILCVGLNYRPHVEEGARQLGVPIDIPQVPVIFTKPWSSMVGHGEPVELDERVSNQLDWEVELAVVIGRGGRSIARQDARDHIFGYSIFNDVSARDIQFRHNQWFLGKGLDRSSPFGPWIVEKGDVVDPERLELSLYINDERMQHARVSDMIFRIDVLIETVSASMSLEPGDVIATGTPDGVGFARQPQIFLRSGDRMRCEIEGIGVLENDVAHPVDERQLSSLATVIG